MESRQKKKTIARGLAMQISKKDSTARRAFGHCRDTSADMSMLRIEHGDDVLTCAICYQPFDLEEHEPRRLCEDDHYACEPCTATLADRNMSCPLCRHPILASDVVGKHGRTARALQCVLASHTKECACGDKVRCADMRAHRATCPATVVACPYGKMGCTYACARQSMQAHVKGAAVMHMDLMVAHQLEAGDRMHQMANAMEKLRKDVARLAAHIPAAHRDINKKISNTALRGVPAQRAPKRSRKASHVGAPRRAPAEGAPVSTDNDTWGSPSYSPTSPLYSPTSPSYSPASPSPTSNHMEEFWP